jgi:hypothetical protein
MVCAAQEEKDPDDELDTLFVKDRSHLLALRVFTSTKYNTLRLGSVARGNDLIYRPTNQFNFGIGASYRKFTLNLGFGIPGLTQQRREELGHTKYLDAQANMFTPERATNLFLQYFQGYHISALSPYDIRWESTTDRPFRPDVTQLNAGISTLRIFNSRRYSYRAALNQDAWQRRSQGSWLLGGYATYYRLRADSSLVPMAIAHRFDERAMIRRGDLVDAGPMGGYAYTIVIKEHFFIMGSAAAGAGISMQHTGIDPPGAENGGNERNTTWGPGWRVQVRGGIGYNSDMSQIGITINHEHVHYVMPIQSMLAWNVGNIRFNIVHRFNKRVKPIDKLMDKLKKDPPPAVEETVPAADEAEDEE